jgi:hypothetical protein
MQQSNQLDRAVAEYVAQQARAAEQDKREFVKQGEAMVAETLEFFSDKDLKPDGVFIHGKDESRYPVAKFTHNGAPIFFMTGRQKYHWYVRASKGVCPKCEQYIWGPIHWMNHDLASLGGAIIELQTSEPIHECPVEMEEREARATDLEPAIKAEPTPGEKLAAAIDEMIQLRIAESRKFDF